MCQPFDYIQKYQNCKCSSLCSPAKKQENSNSIYSSDCSPVYMQALVLRTKAQEKLGMLEQALMDIKSAWNIDMENEILHNIYE